VALDVLLDTLARDAGDHQRRIVDEATAEAARIRAAATASAEARCVEALAVRALELQGQMDARRATAARGARVAALSVRQELLDQIRRTVEAALPGTLDGHEEAVAALAFEAIESLPPRAIVLRCRPGLAGQVQRIAESLGRVRVVSDEAIPEGLEAECEDASVLVHNTLAARLNRQWPALSIAILARIDGAG